MTKKILLLMLIICVALGIVLNSVSAQNKKTGTSAASELLIPVGARDLALGGSSLATSSGVESMFWNPAGLGRMSHSAEGMFSNMTYFADAGVTYGAVAASFGEFGVVGLSVKTISFGDIPLTTQDDPENASGRFFSPNYVTVGLTYARSLTDAISFGGSAKLVNEQIDQVSSSGFALDFGVQYHGLVGITGLSLGVAVKNIGPQMKFNGPGLYGAATRSDGLRPEQRYLSDAASFELPSLVEIGLGYGGSFTNNAVWGLTGSFTNNNLYLDEYRVGGEVGVTMESLHLFGRAGTALVPQAASGSNIFGATFGFGIGYTATGVEVTVDYAYRAVDFFDANQVFSLKVGF